MHFSRSAALAGLASVPLAMAQTFTDCNPMDKSCPNDTGLDSTSWSCDFTKGESALASWTSATGTNITYDDTKGAVFTIAKKGQAPTISTDFYVFFGKFEIVMQASAGTGIVSSVVLESDDLDEIDWEWLGGDTTQAETNYFGKGNTTAYDRATYETVSSPQTTFHTYTIDWTKDKIDWIIDGVTVRTLEYAAANGGENFPQTPMRLKLGNWVGGDPDEDAAGTIEWAGGETDYSDAPFIMYVKTVSIVNYNPAKEYEFSDKTGSYESIKLIDTSDSSSSSSSSSSASASASASVSGSSASVDKMPLETKTVSIKTSADTASDSTNTIAPTSSLSVKEARPTGAVVSTTITSAIPLSTGNTTSSNGNSSYKSSTASSETSQQTTNAGTPITVAVGLFSIVGLTMALFAL